MVRTFAITHGKTKVTIETEETKLDAIDHLVMALIRHYRDHNPERLDHLVGLINVAHEGTQIVEEWAEDEKKKR